MIVPISMATAIRWLVWRYSPEEKKLPHDPHNPKGRSIDATDEQFWVGYDTASKVVEAGGVDGLGFALGDGWAGVDLDDVRDPVTGSITAEAQEIVSALNSYTEVSPSGTGLKIFVKAWLARNHKRPGLEIYGFARYFTVTGLHVAATPTELESRPAELSALIEKEFGDDRDITKSAVVTTAAISDGGRNNGLTSIAGKLRRQGFEEDVILAAVLKHNETHCQPPLERHEVETLVRSVCRYAPAQDTFPLTEIGDAEFFAGVFGNRVRFDWRRRRWLTFSEHRWLPDADGQLFRLATESIRLRQELALGVKDGDERKARLKWTLAGEARKRIENMLSLARSRSPISDAGDSWDADVWLLGVHNGVLDLRSAELRPGRPEDRITMSVRAAYDPTAKCDLWMAKVSEIFDRNAELIGYVQRGFGYSLTGVASEQCLFLNWGSGANGKGTLINTFAWVLGDYADDLPFSALELQQRASIPNDVAKLVGKRFVTSSESNDGVQLNEARIKALTGCDPITARFMRAEFFTFQPVAKFWLASNHKPKVHDDSYGFWRRMRLIPFTQQFGGNKDDKDLKDKLKSEAAGILRWAVEGCVAWQQQGMQTPAVVLDATRDYETECDPLAPFFEQRCLLNPTCEVRASLLFSAYERWCFGRVRERDRLSQKKFGQLIRKRFDAREDSEHRVSYFGIGLLDLTDQVDQVAV